jgi:hypothetical protein
VGFGGNTGERERGSAWAASTAAVLRCLEGAGTLPEVVEEACIVEELEECRNECDIREHSQNKLTRHLTHMGRGVHR